MSVVRILIADDTDLWRDFLKDLLGKEPLFDVICTATDGVTALQLTKQMKPPVVIFDIDMPGLNGIEAARRVRRYRPETKIILLSGDLDRDLIESGLSIGVSGYVLKNDAARELIPAVHSVVQGAPFFSRGLHARIFR